MTEWREFRGLDSRRGLHSERDCIGSFAQARTIEKNLWTLNKALHVALDKGMNRYGRLVTVNGNAVMGCLSNASGEAIYNASFHSSSGLR
jgi:alanine racemase